MNKTDENRVLFLIQVPPPIHGASIMNQSVYNAISSDTQFKTRLISLNFARDLDDLQKVRIGKVFKALAILFKLIWQLLIFRPHTVYFSMVPLNFVLIRDAIYLMAIKTFAPKAKPVLHLHRPGLSEYASRWRLKWFYRIIFKKCEVIHLSDSLIAKEITPLNLTSVRVHSIANFIENYSKSSSSKENSINDNILFLSNLLPFKGFFPLVDAMAIITKKHPKLTLSIAGASPNPEITKQLKSKIIDLGLEKRISIHGEVHGEEKQKLYQKASIFVLPSTSEYFPLVILEAMFYKTAVITSAKSSLQCYFKDKRDILYIDNITPEIIAKEISNLLENPNLRKQIAMNGRLKAEEVQLESIFKIKDILSC